MQSMKMYNTKKCDIGRFLATLTISIVFVLGCSKTRKTGSLESDAPRPSTESNRNDDEPPETKPEPFTQNREIENSLIIGLDADMSSGSAQSGLAIMRGASLAIEEINANGGLLGRPVELVVRDHRGNPDRGVDNIADFSDMSDVLAVVGGLHTPVALRELKTIHENEMIYLGPWAAGTPIVRNGYTPNYVFRVSVRDEFAGGFLVDQALDRGFNHIGLLLERTGWGRSNEVAIQNALKDRGREAANVQWLNLGETDLSLQIERLKTGGAECIILVCNPLEGKATLQWMARQAPDGRLPILSHWGITGGDFVGMTKDYLSQVDLSFLQTYSFVQRKNEERSTRLLRAYMNRFDECKSAHDIFSPVGTAHAYEIVMMLAAAVEKADSIERPIIRDALENLENYQGVIRHYEAPFTPENHDALTADDFIMARFGVDGAIEPIVELEN